jgi:predicted permease
MLAAIVGLTLLLTCANIAGIQLARFTRRRREAAIRAALGAVRTRVFAHFMAEGLVLAAAGGILGLLLAAWLQDLLHALAPAGLRRLEHATVDGSVAAFTIAVTLLAGLIATLWPALATASPGEDIVRGAPVTGTREQRRARDTLVVAQIIIAVALLTGTGALVRSMLHLRNVDIGVRQLDVLVVDLHRRTDQHGPVAATAFYDETLRRVRALPGITGATLATSVPFRPRDYHTADWRRRGVADGYFEALGIPVIAGRTFDDRDVATAEPVAVISRTLAARQFPDADPIGRMLDDYRIIGVVEDVRHESVDVPAEPALYSSLAQRPDARLSLIVRAQQPAASVADAVRGAIAAVDAEQPVQAVALLRQFLDESPAVSRRQFQLNVLLAVAAFALLLAALGVYGVAAQAVVQRTPEIGLRLTMGATRAGVFLLVLGDAARHILTGVLIGAVAGIVFVRVLAAALFRVSPFDPLSIIMAATLLALTALAATALPARHATRIDPVRALRSD